MPFELSLLTSAIPFFFVLAIVYGALDVAGVFKNKAANAIIAIVIGFFAMASEEASAFIMSILPYAAIFFVVVFFIAFILKMFKAKKEEERDFTLIIVVIVLAILFLMSQGYDILQSLLPPGFPVTGENFMLIIGIILIIAIFFAAYKSKGEWGKK
jgi:hypothetical protein